MKNINNNIKRDTMAYCYKIHVVTLSELWGRGVVDHTNDIFVTNVVGVDHDDIKTLNEEEIKVLIKLKNIGFKFVQNDKHCEAYWNVMRKLKIEFKYDMLPGMGMGYRRVVDWTGGLENKLPDDEIDEIF